MISCFYILAIGFLSEKTCILITHQVQYLNNVDHIVLMENVSVVYNQRPFIKNNFTSIEYKIKCSLRELHVVGKYIDGGYIQ